MSVKICKDNLFHPMDGAKIYVNGAWRTVKDLDKIYYGGKWHRINHDTHTWGADNACTVCGRGFATLTGFIHEDTTTYSLSANAVYLASPDPFPSNVKLRQGAQQVTFSSSSTSDKTPILKLTQAQPGGYIDIYDGSGPGFQLNLDVKEDDSCQLYLTYNDPSGGAPSAIVGFLTELEGGNSYLKVGGIVLATTSQNPVTLPVGTHTVKYFSVGEFPRYQDLTVHRTRNGFRRELYHYSDKVSGNREGNSVSYSAELEICLGDLFEFRAFDRY